MINVMCSSGNSLGSLGDCPLPFNKYFVPIADQIILTLFSDKTALPSWLSVSLCTLCSLNHYSAWRFNEMIRVIVINAERSLLLQQNPNFSNHLGKSKWVQIIKRFENSVWLVKGSYVWFKLSGNLKTQELEKSGFYCILLGLSRTLPSLPFTLSSNPHSPALRSLSNDDGDSYENFT